jgi:hypothetical protein
MNVTKEDLNELIKGYGIRQGRTDAHSRKRLAIILADFMVGLGLEGSDHAILERAFLDELERFELISGPTDYEEYLSGLKGYSGIEPIRIALPEGTSYSEDTRLIVVQILTYIERRIKDEAGKSTNRGNTMSGIRSKQDSVGGIKAKGLKVHPRIQNQTLL